MIPLCSTDSEVEKYNRDQMALCRRRRADGRPLRDFESGVFTVAKSDGGHRPCTDYRELNKFAGKSKFQMEGVQEVAELIQPHDHGLRHARRSQGHALDAGSASLAQEAFSLLVPENEGSLPMENGVVRDLRGSENLHEDNPPEKNINRARAAYSYVYISVAPLAVAG
jgi:hypothetical protein